MKKKKIFVILIFYFIIFTSSLYQAPRVKAFIDSHEDPENDVFRIDLVNQKIDKVSSHPQLDITNISLNVTLDSRHVNVTFLGNITGYDMECNIYFFENYNPNNLTFEYSVYYSNLTGTGFKVILVKYIPIGDQYDFNFWDNITESWISSNTSASIIGSFSAYSIEATIPPAAFTISENTTWFALSTRYEGNYIYLDIAPDSFSPVQVTTESFPFEILIFVAIIIVVIFGFYFYRKKKLDKAHN
ncbi:MAG: hypothetical protein ACFFBH_11835 [Promethearchaeota archaeon]